MKLLAPHIPRRDKLVLVVSVQYQIIAENNHKSYRMNVDTVVDIYMMVSSAAIDELFAVSLLNNATKSKFLQFGRASRRSRLRLPRREKLAFHRRGEFGLQTRIVPHECRHFVDDRRQS
jgi:hypothetical protein